MTQMNTDYHDDLIMKKNFAFFASLREIIKFFQCTHKYDKVESLIVWFLDILIHKENNDYERPKGKYYTDLDTLHNR